MTYLKQKSNIIYEKIASSENFNDRKVKTIYYNLAETKSVWFNMKNHVLIFFKLTVVFQC